MDYSIGPPPATAVRWPTIGRSEMRMAKPKHNFGQPGGFAVARNQAGGDWAAAVLLYRVKYRFREGTKKLERHSKEWIAMSRKDWANEAGLSDGEMRNRALPKLRKRQFITIRQMKITPSGPKLLWISLDQTKLNEWTDPVDTFEAQLSGSLPGIPKKGFGKHPKKKVEKLVLKHS